MKLKSAQKIPVDIFRLRRAWASAGVKGRLTHDQTLVWMHVGDIKKAQHAGELGVSTPLPALLDFAATSGQFELFDEFAKAWAKLSRNTPPKPGRKLTLQVLDAIERLQEERDRPPTYREIMARMETIRDGGISETELSSQITLLDLREWLPGESDFA